MEEIWHKLFLIIVKYLPFVMAITYFIAGLISCFEIAPIVIPNLFYMSPVTALFMICTSFAFRFCIWHRLPIYYAMILHLMAIIDYYTAITISSFILLFVYLVIAILFILIGMYFKNRYNKKRKRYE